MLIGVSDARLRDIFLRRSWCELEGARIVISGGSPECRDIAVNAFSDQNAVVSLIDDAFCAESPSAAVAARLHAQELSRDHGTVDAAINFIQLSDTLFAEVEDLDDLETVIAGAFEAAFSATDVYANRMGLTWRNGVILNVLEPPPETLRAHPLLLGLTRSALAAATRQEAERRGGHGVRVNAVIAHSLDVDDTCAFDGCALDTLASILMFAASDASAGLSGVTFDTGTPLH